MRNLPVQTSANNYFFNSLASASIFYLYLLCKQFILSFQALEKILFQYFFHLFLGTIGPGQRVERHLCYSVNVKT